ncbi:MAG TPA: hypothetical protein ENN09_04170, partial [Planctomycetes bacterium]|nr:hypothetical protein [Planctomycetota bacterium]
MVETPRGRFLESTATATVYDNVSLVKGDYAWKNVRVETTLELLPPGGGWGGPAGIVFRFMDSQRYYAAVVDEDGCVKILLRRDANWDVLAHAPASFPLDKPVKIRVDALGARLKASIGNVKLEVENGALPNGCAGFIAARPARFGPIRVAALPGEAGRLKKERAAARKNLAAKRRRFGKPLAWKRYDTSGFGCGRRIRLGDLTGDGEIDFLLIQTNSYKGRGIGCMTAMSSSGAVLWRLGSPMPPPETESSADTPAQIHDVDGDGRNEVVCAYGSELLVLEGATGGIKHKAPLPPMEPLPEIFKRNMLHWGAGFSDDRTSVTPSAIFFADLSGSGSPTEILLLDHYHTTVAMDNRFNELWRDVASHGHFPQAYDFDGDGRQDVLAGYHRLSPEGELLGRVCLQDHQDAIYVGPLDAEGKGPVKILMAGGEDGLLTLTPEYNIRQRVMGHVQRLSIGRFRQDIPGLCVATVLYHGNPGIISLFDSTVKKIWTKDFPVVGATLQPVNWDASGVELMLLTGLRPAQGYEGGLMDGFGELVVPLPDDGGPGFCAFAYDFDADGLDELMLWDYERIWIYHSDKDAPSGGKYRPKRPPLY